MYHVSAQGVDERMLNVHYYYYLSHFGGSVIPPPVENLYLQPMT